MTERTDDLRTDPLRVLLLLHNLDVGGAQISVVLLAEQLLELGWNPIVCAWRRGGTLEKRLIEAGITVEPPVPSRSLLSVVRRLRALHMRHRIDIVHGHMSDAAVLAVVLERFVGGVSIITHHSPDLVDTLGRERPVYGWGRLRLLIRCAKRATHNIAVSEEVAASLGVLAKLASERVSVIPPGVRPPPEATADAVLRRRKRAHQKFEHGGPHIVQVGRLVHEKGAPTLLKAVKQVVADYPDATFDLLGEGPLREDLERMIEQLGLKERVHLVGEADDLDRALAGADLMVAPSLAEGMPVSVLEAMMRRLPLVLSDIAPHRELACLRAGDAALLAPVDDPGALAKTILRALGDHSASQLRSERAASLVNQHHTSEQMAQQHIAVYRRSLPTMC